MYGADPGDDLKRPHDAFQNPAFTLTLLQNCTLMFQSTNTNIGDDHGYRWAMGITGYSMFNTVQTPNDSKYTFGACRLDGGPNTYPDDGFTWASSSAHPTPCRRASSWCKPSQPSAHSSDRSSPTPACRS